MKSADTNHAKRQGRLDVETWLEGALEALAAKGPQVLTVEKLCHELGVSRGSFYWHFKDRADFVRRLAKFWEMRFTQSIRETVAIEPNGPAERLMLLIETIQDLDVNRFDMPVRAWAIKEPLAEEIVKRVDNTRYQYVRSQFKELGFSGDELEMRTRTFVVFHSMQDMFTLQESAAARKHRRKLRHRLLTSK
jgi:AcrR family transcriptional regulator